MKNSEIRFHIELDEAKIPEKIFWNATDNPSGQLEETKAIAISVWDLEQRETLRIDLWTKDMPVDEMKLMAIDTMGGIAETLRKATDDHAMADKIIKMCDELFEHVKQLHYSGAQQPNQ